MDALAQLTEIVASSPRVVVLTGAGMSAESGIPTFRDPGGFWEILGEQAAAAGGLMRMLIETPWIGIDLLKRIQAALGSAAPNAGHVALAALERAGHVRAVITQNVDGLHTEAGSARVLEMHGSFARRRCLGCGRTEAVSRAQMVSDLEEMILKLGSFMVSHPAHVLRRCECGGLIRADVVEFGEAVYDLPDAMREAAEAGVMLVCGTSGVVYPAAGLPEIARDAGATIVEVNPHPTELSSLADVVVRGTAADVLRFVAGSIVEAESA